jgi:hypothetical protein
MTATTQIMTGADTWCELVTPKPMEAVRDPESSNSNSGDETRPSGGLNPKSVPQSSITTSSSELT